MNRTLVFTLIGAILGGLAATVYAYYDNSGSPDSKVSSMVFCGICGALMIGLLGYGIAKVDNSPQSKSVAQKPKLSSDAQFGLECLGAVALIGMAVFRLTRIPENAPPWAYGWVIGSVVGVLVYLGARAWWWSRR